MSWILVLAAAFAAATAFAAAPSGAWEELRAQEGLHVRGGSCHLVLGPYLLETSGTAEGLLLEKGRPVARGALASAAMIAANPDAASRLKAIAAQAAAVLASDYAAIPDAGRRPVDGIALHRVLALAGEARRLERAGS